MENFLSFEAVLEKILSAGIAVALLFGLIALLIRKARIAFGKYLVGLSYAMGTGMWLNCAFTVFAIWRWIGLIIGVLLFGIGVVPLAAVALLFHGEWKLLGYLALSLFMVFGIRYFGAFVADREELRRKQEASYVLSMELEQ